MFMNVGCAQSTLEVPHVSAEIFFYFLPTDARIAAPDVLYGSSETCGCNRAPALYIRFRHAA